MDARLRRPVLAERVCGPRVVDDAIASACAALGAAQAGVCALGDASTPIAKTDTASADVVAGSGEDALNNPYIDALTRLVAAVRPRRASDTAEAARNFDALIRHVESQASARAALCGTLQWLLVDLNAVHLYTDSGVLANEGFFTAFSNRLWHKLLPEELNYERLKDVVARIFDDRDHLWIVAIPDEIWESLLRALQWPRLNASPAGERISLQLLDALEVISYRITAIGLEPEIVHIYPAIERYESPFLMQNVEVRQLFDDRQQAMQEQRESQLDHKHLLVMLEQCEDMIGRIRKQAEKSGASLGLTALLVRLRQNIDRMQQLLALLGIDSGVARGPAGLHLLRAVVAGEARRNSLRDLVSLNVELMAQRITHNAGRAGEAYITFTRSEYFALLRSAMGAGALVAVMAAIKLWLGREHHAPFVQALIYSSNYIAGFVLMYVLHFSLATKQPAMTASRIAHSLDVPEKGRDRLENLADLVVRTLRSQFIAIVGNIVVAVPLALLIGYSLARLNGAAYVQADQLPILLAQANPLRALTWVHAAFTGIALFLTGLISGYYDNKASYSRIPQRLQQLRGLRRLLGTRGAARFARYVGEHLGGIAGSMFFGLMLGSAAALGAVLGIPIDTLHVTFVSANTAYAALALGDAFTRDVALLAVAGIAAVGLMNLSVSFGLALYVAMRAQRVRFNQALPLTRHLLLHFLRRPHHFFFPPADPPAAPQDSAETPKIQGR